jgi:hypothetical protein
MEAMGILSSYCGLAALLSGSFLHALNNDDPLAYPVLMSGFLMLAAGIIGFLAGDSRVAHFRRSGRGPAVHSGGTCA